MISNEEINQIIINHLTIRVKEKNVFGEVFTPPLLIEQMFQHLPSHVWSNPFLTWLDPTGGVGNFLLIAYQKLMTGLEGWEQDPEKRSEHILKNMLYIVEINGENVEILKKVFVNVLHEDFLQSNTFDLKFDIIVGNPPFQDPVLVKKRVGSKNKLYERITLKCMDLLKPGAYLLFLVPDNLFSGNSMVYNRLAGMHLILLNFDKKIQTFFPKIQQYVCYFLLENIDYVSSSSSSFVQMIGNHGQPFECLLTNRIVNPVRNWCLETETLMRKYIQVNPNGAVYCRGKPIRSYLHKGTYPLIYKPGEKLFVNDSSSCVGLGQKKIVLFVISPDLEFEVDFAGLHGVGPNTIYIPFSTLDEGLLLQSFFKSNIYRSLAFATKVTRQFLKIKFIQHLNIPFILH